MVRCALGSAQTCGMVRLRCSAWSLALLWFALCSQCCVWGLLGPGAESVSVGQAAAERPLWLPPLGSPLRVSGPYLAPATPYTSGHRGIDLPASPGGTVRAPVAGEVSFVGHVVDRGVLSIRVDARTVVSFEPIGQGDPALALGDHVSRGQVIGVLAEGGHCASECLHLGVRIDGDYVNPLRFFVGRPVLLPW